MSKTRGGVKPPSLQNTADLRKMLIETIQQVRSGDIEPSQARTIAALSTTILHSAKLDLDFLRFHAANDTLNKAGQDVLPLLPATSA